MKILLCLKNNKLDKLLGQERLKLYIQSLLLKTM